MPKIILATASLRRKTAFTFLGIPFEAEDSKIDESQEKRDNPEELVKKLSRSKAEAVARNHQDAIVIGMDSVGWFNNQILEKIQSKEEAFQRLKSLSGDSLQFYTGVFMINTVSNESLSRVVKTEVFLREIPEMEINEYLDEGQDFQNYALGYDPLEHSSSAFIKRIEGSYNNLTRGIPLEEIVEMLCEIGYKE
jgi:MAF protein